MRNIDIRKIFIFSITFFILVLPYSRLKFGPLPIYFVDLVTIGSLVYMAPYSLKASKLGRVILLYLLFTLLTGAVELIMYRSIDSIYMLMRYSLSMASVLVLPKLILNSNYFRVLMKAVALSLVINAVLASSWVFPVTRSAMQIVFKQEILYPQKDAFLEDLEKDQASRGRTLAGNSNSTAF